MHLKLLLATLLVINFTFSMSIASVPEKMFLTATMAAANLSKGILIALKINGEEKSVTEFDVARVEEVIKKHSQSHGSLCFVVRRPGKGQQLAELAAQKDESLEGFGLWGVVKETGVDDEGLSEFYSKSFSYPLYRDEGLIFYNDFFGKSKIGLSTFNPFTLYKGYTDMTARLNAKGIEGNLKGEGMVQGGIIIFDKNGMPSYAYREETGSPLPISDIKAALDAMKSEKTEF